MCISCVSEVKVAAVLDEEPRHEDEEGSKALRIPNLGIRWRYLTMIHRSHHLRERSPSIHGTDRRLCRTQTQSVSCDGNQTPVVWPTASLCEVSV